ncbi:hypothetical protein CMEL01_09669, partial [Colletotrichum melonis]
STLALLVLLVFLLPPPSVLINPPVSRPSSLVVCFHQSINLPSFAASSIHIPSCVPFHSFTPPSLFSLFPSLPFYSSRSLSSCRPHLSPDLVSSTVEFRHPLASVKNSSGDVEPPLRFSTCASSRRERGLFCRRADLTAPLMCSGRI